MATDGANPASPSFSEDLETTLHRAIDGAVVRGHKYATLEHLLLALIDDPSASGVMMACGVDLAALREPVEDYLNTELDALKREPGEEERDTEPTSGFQRVIQRSILHVQSSGRKVVEGGNVLTALFSERESYAVYFLQQQDLSRLDVVSYISHGVGKAAVEPTDVDRDFFISYAGEDVALAQDIDGVLRAAGFSTVAQFKDFLPSANFVREMQRGLARSARLIAIHSPSYEASDHCQAEWAAAYGQDPGGTRGKIVPFLIAPTELNPLARQIIYTSLVGLDLPARHMAVLQAVRRIASPMGRSDIAREAARVASPDVALRGAVLDAVPNASLDRPVPAEGLADLPHLLRSLVDTIVEALPANAPPVVGSCMSRYSRHLDERGAQPIVGLLNTLVAAVEREFRSAEMALWGPGLDDLLRSFFAKHVLFTTYFPRSEDRERFFAETPIDEDRAIGDLLETPIRQASEALAAVSAEGLTSPQFDSIIAGQRRQAADLASLPPAAEQRSDAITPKRRFVLGSIGFYERVLAILGNSAKLLDSAAVHSARVVLRHSIDALSHLLP